MNEILLVNPRRRRKSKGRKRSRVRLKRSASRRRKVVRARRYKRNPVASLSPKSLVGSFVPTLKAGAVGAVGAIANDALIGQLGRFLPAFLSTGYARHLTKVGTAVIVGAVGNLALRGKGQALAAGAATCAMRDLIRETIQQNLPSVAPYLGDYDDGDSMGSYNPGLLVNEGVGEYMQAPLGDVGEYIPMMNGDDGM
jgi:hypothetical protein